MNKKTSFAPTDSRHWLEKVKRNSNGATYGVQIQFQGTRKRFPLYTGNKHEAAKKAAEIYIEISKSGGGWDKALDKFKPHLAKNSDPTFGDVFAALEGQASVRSQTLGEYTRSCRKIVSSVKGIDGGTAKFDHVNGGREAWLAKVDSVKISEITPSLVRTWRDEFINEKSDGLTDSKKKHQAKVSSNTFIRNAKCLFSADLLIRLKDKGLILCSPLPFHDEDGHSKKMMNRIDPAKLKYKSTFDFGNLILKAREELAPDPKLRNQWLAFLFCGLAGLRREEVDKLLWENIDLETGLLTIASTEHHELKNSASEDGIQLDPEFIELLRGHRANAKGKFVLWSLKTDAKGYRCNRDLNQLVKWLRASGVDSTKPLHALRKECASHLYETQGLDVASKYLRHADITTTARFYADTSKKKVITGLGKHLVDNSENVLPINESKTA